MNTKSYIISSLVVFVFISLAEFLFHAIIMNDIYSQNIELLRPEADSMSKMIWMQLGFLIMAFGFCYIFTVGYKGKGIMEGVRYGLIVAVTFFVSASLIDYTVYPYPDVWIFSWIIGYSVMFGLAGAIAALLYKPSTA